MGSALIFLLMVAYPFPSAATEALVDCSTERLRRRYPISTPKDGTFIRPGKPVDNAFIESFHGRMRDECLNVHQFASLAEAQAIIEAWRVDDNTRRPHRSLGHLTPSEFVRQRQEEQIAEEALCSG